MLKIKRSLQPIFKVSQFNIKGQKILKAKLIKPNCRNSHMWYQATTSKAVGNKGKLLSRKASCRHEWQVAVTCRRGTSVVRNLKFLTLPCVQAESINYYYINQQRLFNYNSGLFEQVSLVILILISGCQLLTIKQQGSV